MQLVVRSNLYIALAWDSLEPAKGGCMISADVLPILGEMEKAYDNCTDGAVITTIPGTLQATYGLTCKTYQFSSTI